MNVSHLSLESRKTNLLTFNTCHQVHCSTFNWRHLECYTREIRFLHRVLKVVFSTWCWFQARNSPYNCITDFHRKTSNFKNVRKLRTSTIVWDGTNDDNIHRPEDRIGSNIQVWRRTKPNKIHVFPIEYPTSVNNASVSRTTHHCQLKLVRPPGKRL